MSDKELAQMVPIEARKYVPVPIGEVTLDWWVIPKEDIPQVGGSQPKAAESGVKKVSSLDVMLAVIHNDAITKYENLAKAAALNSSFLEIEIFSTIRATLDHSSGTVVIFDLGAASAKLYLVEKGILRRSHIVSRGSQDITLAISQSFGISVNEAETKKREIGYTTDPKEKNLSEVITLTLDYIFAEAKRVIVNYQKQTRKSVEKVVLTGGGVNLKGFEELARQALETPVEIADPYAKVVSPAFLGNVLRSAGPEFAVALGVALRRIQGNS